MKNVFLFTSTNMARTLIFNIEYVLNCSIDKIFLLDENHNKNEVFAIDSHSQVCICNKFEKCVEQSDIIITSNDKKAKIGSFLIDDKKDIIIINDYSNQNHKHCTNIPNLDYQNKPVIAIMSLGYYTDQYFSEILINKILSEQNAKIVQMFSPETKAILTSLTSFNCINPNLNITYDNDYDIIVIPINEITGFSQLFQVINKILPDVLFLCINNSFNKINEIKQYLKNICNIDAIVKSPYISYEVAEGNRIPVYCNNVKSDHNIISISEDLERELKLCITNKIFLPNGIRIL